jgi:hypothetical protein
MKIRIKIFAIVLVILLVFSAAYLLFFNQGLAHEEDDDIIPPEITSITGDVTGLAGQSVTVSVTFSDNTGVTYAELFYRPASANNWRSIPILSGDASIILPSSSLENLLYYIIVDDAAGNGPVGDPSVDGSLTYIITVLNATDGDNNDGNDNGDDINHPTGYTFLEMPKPIISCVECPKIAAMLDELYDSGDYPFYYVTLPEANEKGAARIVEYNVFGYPTIYFAGGYDLLIGSTMTKSMVVDKILSAAARQHANLSITVSAERKENNSEMTVKVLISNHESFQYSGQLRVYLTEIISTTGQGNTPTRFSLLDYLINEQIQVPAKDSTSLTKIVRISGFDADNLMIFAVVFNAETHIKYSQPPDKNQFNAHYVDVVDATTVVKGGNLPPEVGIQIPSAKYLYIFGKPVRKTSSGYTVLLGKTTLIADAKDDSKIEKVEFYINGKLMKTVTDEPYVWLWNQFAIGKKTITVQAYDDQGKNVTATLDVRAFILGPALFSTLVNYAGLLLP